VSHNPQPAASTSPAAKKRSGSATPPHVLSAPVPAWTQTATAVAATQESVVSTAAAETELDSTTPPRTALRIDGPASSLGDLLGNVQSAAAPTAPAVRVAPTPLKRPRTTRWMAEARGTALLEVPIEALAVAEGEEPDESEQGPRRYPRRVRIPTLDFWRGERVIYKRTKGSATPSVEAVLFNGAPRSENMSSRTIPSRAVQQAKPVIIDGQQAEFVSTNTQRIESKLVVLPPFSGSANPPTFVLPPCSMGHLFVIQGSLRYGFEEEYPQATLNAGDHLLLPGYAQELLLSVAGTRFANSGAKFKVILVSADATARSQNAAPLTPAPLPQQETFTSDADTSLPQL